MGQYGGTQDVYYGRHRRHTHREAFSFNYDLPNDTAYAETCAAIGLVFLARRMLEIKPVSQYADVMERALYNGVLGRNGKGRQIISSM